METNNKHTAGEWKATGLEIRHKNNSMILATVYPHLPLNQSREEAEANARIIAAAPKLLEALKAVYNDIDLDKHGSSELNLMVQSAIKEATK